LRAATGRGGAPARTGHRFRGAAAILLLTMVAGPPGVDVNFITVPYEATIYLDGEQLVDRNRVPYRRPYTVPNLPPGVHDLVLRHSRHADLHCELVDFTTSQEIGARWDTAP
jgi:hypothetical protein